MAKADAANVRSPTAAFSCNNPATHTRTQAPPAPSQTPMSAAPTSAGDSAGYERRALSCDDVVIVSACRTALCKAKRGGFKDTPADDLVAAVLQETIRRTGVEPEVGCVGIGWAAVEQVELCLAGWLVQQATYAEPDP